MGEKQIRLYPFSIEVQETFEVRGEPDSADNGKVSTSRFTVILAGKQKWDQIGDMVGMGVGIEKHVNVMDGNPDFEQPLQGSAPRINKEYPVASSNDRGRRTPREGRYARARPQNNQFHGVVILFRLTNPRPCIDDGELSSHG